MLNLSSDTNSDSQTREKHGPQSNETGNSEPKEIPNYYYDDSTGYEIYREADENDEDDTDEISEGSNAPTSRAF
jgi:hypothetical protein